MAEKRTIKKQFWVSESEDRELKRKAEMACLTESELMRQLVKSYLPKEKPGKEFYQAMQEITRIGRNLNQLLVNAKRLGFTDALLLRREIDKLNQFQLKIEKQFLAPEEDKRWR